MGSDAAEDLIVDRDQLVRGVAGVFACLPEDFCSGRAGARQERATRGKGEAERQWGEAGEGDFGKVMILRGSGMLPPLVVLQ